MSGSECGCRIEYSLGPDNGPALPIVPIHTIVHCSLHSAASDLLAALKAQSWRLDEDHFSEACSMIDKGPCPDFCVQARAAISKARGDGA